MKRIGDYRRLLGVNHTTELKELKTVYRNFMKEYHPDKFTGSESLQLEAQEKSKSIIEAYHFLVSINPETQKQFIQEYTLTTTSAIILDFQHKGLTLKINFSDGSIYEYFNVPKSIYIKLINADSQGRFARRHIYNSFLYRTITKSTSV